jgi:hypothetical protein
MKINIKNFIVALVACCAVVWSACGDKATLDSVGISPDGARVKFFHALVPSTRRQDTTRNAVVIFSADKKWSAVLNTFANGADSITYGGVFPTSDYAVLPAGTANLKVKLPASLNPDTTLLAYTGSLEANSYYTLIAADTLPTPRFILVKDNRTVNKNVLKSYYRVVNAVSGAPATGYDIYLRRQSTSGPIATLKFGESSDYFEIDPNTSTTNDTLFARPQGSTTTAYLTANLLTSTFTANRIRTIIIRGVAVPGINTSRTAAATILLNN